jgi:putative FmdB family regulatory protein
MPTYQYECRNCGIQFEEKQKFSDPPLTDCPICQTVDTVQRVIGPVGVIFKGSGFYINDSKQKNGSSNGSSTSNSTTSKDSTPKASESPPATAEAKPEKTEAKSSEA